jgi:hypothetical protein
MLIDFVIFTSCPTRRRLSGRNNIIITLGAIPSYTGLKQGIMCQPFGKNGQVYG